MLCFGNPMHHRPAPKSKREILPKTSCETGSSASKDEGGAESHQPPGRPRRRRKRVAGSQERILSPLCTRVAIYLVISWIVVTAARTFIFSRSSTSDFTFRRHFPLYDRVYQLARDNEESSQGNKKIHVNDEREPALTKEAILSSSYGSNVTACSVTVLFMDPRIGDPSYGPGQAAWFALESVAAFAEHACVLLLTSSCTMKEQLEAQRHEKVSEGHAEEAVKHAVYSKSLPLFREMILQGRVRLSILDTAKYRLKSCRDFGNPTAAFVNVDFWRDEFQGIDSDSVLMMQDDAVLCTSLHEQLADYKQYAYVGGVWPPKASKLHPNPPQGMCVGMAGLWKSWMLPQRRWERFQKELTDKPATEPDELLETQFPAVCADGNGPVGNGGFSLRSREWTVKAITTCPHVKFSGVDTGATTALACKVLDSVNEDVYFSVVLRGLHAPMPSAVEAALFSVEMMWPEDAMDLYGAPPGKDEILSKSSRPRISDNEGRALTIPIGIHKPFWYHSNELLRSKSMHQACPFLPYIFTPNMSRWREFAPEKQWVGVGT
jgi:hypothetical protein